jgi:DNA polymerase III sliding clamp (beta) subunit (PCNA family)
LNTLTVDTADLADTIARVRVNSDPDYASIFLTLVPGKKTADGISWSLAVRARDRQHNTAQETIECSWSGSSKARELCLNHKYLSDLLASYDSELAIFKVGDDTKTQRHALFIEDSATGFTGVISQMRSEFM